MAARLAMGIKAAERLRRLSVLFAVELRLKIVVELYMREMSAKSFYNEFGGGSLARVHQNFTALLHEGWLSLVYSLGPGKDRRGATEYFYRATEPAFFDPEAWALVPYSVRATSALNLFKQIAPRLRCDVEESYRKDRLKRELTCTDFSLDEEGWTRATKGASDLFARLFEEQEDARRRVVHSGETLYRSDVFLITFQGPDGRELPAANKLLVERAWEPLIPFPERLAPILRDEVYRAIMSELNQRETSVTQFHREFGGTSKPAIGRRFKGLEGGGWTVKGKTMTGGMRRGATEQFYCPTIPAVQAYDPCANPPRRHRGTEGWKTFERLCEEVKRAMLAGTFDARTDRLLTWSLIRLDGQGWESIIAEIESLYEFIRREQKRAKARMAKSGEQPVTMFVALAAFDATSDLIKAV